jgi:tetratricopeptide (TPR) repeat protein
MRLRLICLIGLLMAASARAEVATEGLTAAELEQRSRAHFELARAHLDLREYDAAIKEFDIGYQYKPLPLFLYNIAQVAVLEGKRSMALEYFQKYLSANPRAPEKAEVTRKIAELQRSLAADPEPPSKPDEPMPGGSAGNAATTGTGTGASAAATSSAAMVSEPAPPKRKSNKAWIAIGVVGGLLVIGGAVAIGVTQSVHNDSGYNDWGTLVVNGRR